MAEPAETAGGVAPPGRPLGELRVQLGVYRRLVGARLRADWQYRTSFLLLLASQTLFAGADLAVIAVLFGQVDALAGWSAVEVALLFGLAGTAFGLGDLFTSQVEFVSRHIRAGTFDAFLLRPMWPLLQLSSTEFALRRVGRLVQPAAVFAFALGAAGIEWTPVRLLLVPLAVASGAVVFGALWILTSSLAFWTVNTQEVANAFTYGGNLLTQYPFEVLGPWLRRLATFVIPLAFVAYLPATYLLGRRPALGLPRQSALLVPLVAVVMAAAAGVVWRVAVRHYRSTGS